MHSALVLPVTLCSELAVDFSDTAAAPSGTIGSTDAQASILPVTLDPQIAIALADVIAPTPCSDAPLVQPVLKAWLLHA